MLVIASQFYYRRVLLIDAYSFHRKRSPCPHAYGVGREAKLLTVGSAKVGSLAKSPVGDRNSFHRGAVPLPQRWRQNRCLAKAERKIGKFFSTGRNFENRGRRHIFIVRLRRSFCSACRTLYVMYILLWYLCHAFREHENLQSCPFCNKRYRLRCLPPGGRGTTKWWKEYANYLFVTSFSPLLFLLPFGRSFRKRRKSCSKCGCSGCVR